MTSTIKVDTISENTSANGVAIDGVTLKDGGIAATLASTITTADNTDTLTLISTDTDAAAGPNLHLYRNQGTDEGDDDVLGQIKFSGRNDNAQDVLFYRQDVQSSDVSDGAEDGQVRHLIMINGSETEFLRMNPAGFIFNEGGIDIDFRVESNDNANMLFVDGGANRVGMITTPDLGIGLHIRESDTSGAVDAWADLLVLEGNSDSGMTILTGPNKDGSINFGDSADNDAGRIVYNHNANELGFYNGGASRWRINTTGNLIPGAVGLGIHLGVSAATASNLLDDYEEGTWTPTIKSHSNTISRSGGNENFTYTKIGRQVTVHFSLSAVTLSGTIQNAGDFTRIQGLPFTTSTTAAQRYPSTQLMYFSSGSKFEEENIVCNVGTNSNYIEVLEHDGAGTGYSSARLANVTGGTYWFFTMTYFV